MKSRFKAKPNISAARERARSSSVDGRARVGSDSSLQTKTGVFELRLAIDALFQLYSYVANCIFSTKLRPCLQWLGSPRLQLLFATGLFVL